MAEIQKLDIQEVLADVLAKQDLSDGDKWVDYVLEKTNVGLGLHVKIEGSNYHSSLTASVAQSLVDIQNDFYRAVSLAFSGEENLKKFTSEQKEKYLLVFKITEGSADIETNYVKALRNLCKDFLKNMTSAQKVVLAAIICATWSGHEYINAEQAKEIAKIDAQKDAQRLNHMNKVVDRLNAHNEKIIGYILKGAKDADKITINKKEYSSQDIADANTRAEKADISSETITSFFHIYQAKTRPDSQSKFTLSSKETGEFPVFFDEEEADQDSVDKFWNAFKNRSEINLTVTVTKKDKIITQGSIISVN